MTEKKLIVKKVKENMAKIIARSRYDEYIDPGIDCSKDPGATKQNFKDECDIDKILERGARTGFYPVVNNPGRYADVSEVTDYQQALQVVSNAQSAFMALDAKVRKKFDNDPVKFLQFMNDEKNIEEMVELGLATSEQLTKKATAGQSSEGSKGVSTPSSSEASK